MDNGPRKATDILLELEAKVDALLNYVKSQDMNIKILSNKLNSLMEKSAQLPAAPQSPYTVEAIQNMPGMDANKQIPVSAEFQLPLETSPKGFRRTSRPESYAGDNAYLQKPPSVQTPPPGRAEAFVPPQAMNQPAPPVQQPQASPQQTLQSVGNSIPVVQRIVDKNGKSVFLADIDILNTATMEMAAQIRTNGAGKWSASLGVGRYRVTIRKRENLTKEKIEVTQDITVDGSQSPLELPMMIIK